MHAMLEQNAENIPEGQRLRAVHQELPVCLIEQDRCGTILRACREAAAVYKTAPKGLRGMKLTDLVAPSEHLHVLDAMARAARLGEGRAEVTLRRGAAFPAAQLRIRKTRQATFATELTPVERRAANDTSVRREALPTDQLADVSHEIRTPLNAVIGFADALRQESFGPLGDRRYRDYAKLIQESGQHVLALVNDLLDLSKAEADKFDIHPEPVHAGRIIEGCAEMLRLEAERAGLTLGCDIAPAVGTLRVDPKILRQVVLNLLSNALKFTEHGEVQVRARVLDGNLVVQVSDTGVGMSAEDLERVGERFYQGRAEGVRGARGSGLGLALSRALASAHGGRLDIASKPGRGTCATLSLPLSEGHGGDAPRRRRAAEVVAIGKEERHAG